MTALFEANTVINSLPLYSANIDNDPSITWQRPLKQKKTSPCLTICPTERLGYLGREHHFKGRHGMVNVRKTYSAREKASLLVLIV